MKIAVTADIHADIKKMVPEHELDRLKEAIYDAHPDVFIIAGDLVGLGKKYIAPTLKDLAPPACEKLIVPGNHDLWLAEGDSYEYYRNALPKIYKECGFHMLDTGPRILGEIAFAGNIGWYDYSFMDPSLPPSRERRYDLQCWDRVAMWNDAVCVKRPMSDTEFHNILLNDLRRQIAEIPQSVKTIVMVTHMVAFEEMVVRSKKDQAWNFCNAFLGGRKLGELFLSDPRIKYHFCGHTHTIARVEKGGMVSINVGSTYEKKRLEILQF
jgi:putative phosphoesterase